MSSKRRKTDNVNINIKSDGSKPSYYSQRYRKYRYPYAKYAKQLRDGFVRGTDTSIATWGADRATASPAQLALRKAARYYGKGAYSLNDVAKYGIRGAGAIAGGLAALPSGNPMSVFNSGMSGWNAGANLSKWAGFGDYAPVATNSIMGGASNAEMNSQQNICVNASNDEGDVTICFTEFVQNITVTGNGTVPTSPFAVQTFSLNPGLQSVFPWLSQVANNFTLYEFEGLMFQYKPNSGEYGSANANTLGKVIMCTNYDPSASPFINAQGMENYDYAVAVKPSCGAIHAVETAPKQRFSNQLYVRNGNVSKDKVLTDLGLFQVATEGIYAPTNGVISILGELWVTYKVKLSRKYLGDQIGNTIDYDCFNSGNAQFTIVNGSNIFGSVTASNTAITYQFPQNLVGGYYMITILMAATTITSGSISPYFTTTATQNCTAKALGPSGLSSQFPVAANNTNGIGIVKNFAYNAMVKISAPGTLVANITASMSCPDGYSIGSLFVQQIAQALYDNDPQ